MKTNKVNDIDLDNWKDYDDVWTDSLWLIDKRGEGGSANYPGNFVPQIPEQLIKRYTEPGDWVIDPFCGSGTTSDVADTLGRNSLNVDLSSYAINTIKTDLPRKTYTLHIIHQGDSKIYNFSKTLENYGSSGAMLAILHPPYSSIIQYSADIDDLSACVSVPEFVSKLREVVMQVREALKPMATLALVIGDFYTDGRWTPLGFKCMNAILKCGFGLKSIIVKNFTDTFAKRNQEHLWRYRALQGGFYIFKHEYIFIFEKET